MASRTPPTPKDQVFAWVPLRNRKPTVIHSLTSVQIYRMTKGYNPASQRINGGLTRVNLHTTLRSVAISSQAINSADPSKLSFFFEPLHIDMTFEWVKIWLARELKHGSRPYNAILTHEEKHVALAHNVLRNYAQRLEGALNQAGMPTRGAPVPIPKSKAAYQAEDAKYRQVVKKIITDEYIKKLQKIYNDIDAAWKGLDTPAEYRRVRLSAPAHAWPF